MLIAFGGVIELSADPPATLMLVSSWYDLSNLKALCHSQTDSFKVCNSEIF